MKVAILLLTLLVGAVLSAPIRGFHQRHKGILKGFEKGLAQGRLKQMLLRDEEIIKEYIEHVFSESEAYERLAELTDTYAERLTGTDSLERAIDWVIGKMKQDQTFDLVSTEAVSASHWVRGNEFIELLEPRATNISMLGLGMSTGTGPAGITAEVIVVKDFDELAARADEVPGKIVLYNAPYVTYSETGVYRRTGAIEAAKYGAVASLVRSVGPFSLYSPHTGNMEAASIPAAAITIEDSELLQRFQDRGQKIVLHLYMEAHFLSNFISRNIIADYLGTDHPEEVVVMGGHIDSWDVGTGALDDGGGIVAAWEAVRRMKALNMRPKRTVRVVMWTNEENGAKGADVYYQNRLDQIDQHIFALESDSGCFTATGIGFTGSDEAYAIMKEIGETYLSEIGAGNVTRGGGGKDIDPLCKVGVPCAGLVVSNGAREDKTDIYFNFHHTEADTMSAIRREELDSNVAAMGTYLYAVANLAEDLPRGSASDYVPYEATC